MRRTRAAAQHGRYPRMQRIVDLLRRDEMDMRIHPPRRKDAPLARDDLGPRPDDDIDAGLRVRVPRLADLRDPPVAQAHIGLDDARPVHDHSIGDDRIHRARRPRDLALPHPVADHLAAAELHLLAIAQRIGTACGPLRDQVALHLDDQVGIAQPDTVAHRGTIHVGIGGAGNHMGHQITSRTRGSGTDSPDDLTD